MAGEEERSPFIVFISISLVNVCNRSHGFSPSVTVCQCLHPVGWPLSLSRRADGCSLTGNDVTDPPPWARCQIKPPGLGQACEWFSKTWLLSEQIFVCLFGDVSSSRWVQEIWRFRDEAAFMREDENTAPMCVCVHSHLFEREEDVSIFSST